MPVLLERSGCGCTLKTGTIVIGVLQALAGFSMMVSEALAAYRYPGPRPVLAAPELGVSPAQERDIKQYVQGQKGLCVVLSAAGGLQLLLSILLLYGADYDNPRLVKPWIVFSLILTTIIIAVYAGLAILTFVLGYRTVGVTILLGIIFTTGISTYFMMVVYSFYRYLVDSMSPPCII